MPISWSFQNHYPDFILSSISTSLNCTCHLHHSLTMSSDLIPFQRSFWKQRMSLNLKRSQMFERSAITSTTWWSFLINPLLNSLGFPSLISQMIMMSSLSSSIIITLHGPSLWQLLSKQKLEMQSRILGYLHPHTILHLPLFPYLLHLHPMTLSPMSLILHLHPILIDSHTIHHQSWPHNLIENPILGTWIASPSPSCPTCLRGLQHHRREMVLWAVHIHA